MGIATGVLTLLILVFGEITPKTVSTISSETIALRFARPIYIVMWVLTPVIFIVNKFSYAVLFILRVDPNRKQEGITEDELKGWFAVCEKIRSNLEQYQCNMCREGQK